MRERFGTRKESFTCVILSPIAVHCHPYNELARIEPELNAREACHDWRPEPTVS